MKKAEHYLHEELTEKYLTPLQVDGIIRAIKKAQIEAIDETIAQCERNHVSGMRKVPLSIIADRIKCQL